MTPLQALLAGLLLAAMAVPVAAQVGAAPGGRLRELEERLREAQEKLEAARRSESGLRSQLRERDGELAQRKVEADKLRGEIEQLRGTDERKAVLDLQAQLQAALEARKRAEESLAASGRERDEIAAARARLESDLARTASGKSVVERQLAETQEAGERRIAEMSRKIEASEAAARRAGEEKAEADKQIGDLKRRLERAENALKGAVQTLDPECPQCPRMVVVPPGRFLMGSPDNEVRIVGRGAITDEGPQREVRIDYWLAVGKFEVTFDEWDRCVAEKACPQLRDKWGRGRQPVINVSWEQARDYAKWLNSKARTGEGDPLRYRLLSEAEWEYAARARTRTPFATGACIGSEQANYAATLPFFGTFQYPGCEGRTTLNREKTVEAGSLGWENAFGLADMHGNVSEWVEDCWHDDYGGNPPSNGDPWLQGCSAGGEIKVARGGNWTVNAKFPRSAVRERWRDYVSNDSTGFRLARRLP